MEKKGRSWACTFVLQVSLSIAFYLALNLGQPQKSIYLDRNGASSSTRPLDVYFLSVRGGYRPLKQQNLLLKKMEKVANFFSKLGLL
ncbi:CALCINEURIN-LIKE METALLO-PHOSPHOESTERASE SUPERFAMILY PROTEIN [Salix koriyanagi]|uniref:CALCINEURIN-LIKE METALLO-PHOSPHOESTERASE SUPERFAMILY PROTEIN n=1 Tax=Salix koriyanagi TaxID=2511006 RepID=A0A9Q0W4N8_9ROSI|nr:CALCINEURIN-LIKE METALLO-PHOSPHOESTERASE SUPERFAMILY PROTEIN [Salix koriyanagi]